MVVEDVALVVDLDEHVRRPAIEKPRGHRVDRVDDGCLVLQALVLPEVEEADDRDHAELVGAVENPPEPGERFRPRRAVGRVPGVPPRLLLRVARGRAALHVDREGENTVAAPLGHRGEELARVPLRVPAAGVGVGPPADGRGVPIVERALHHPRVQQEAFDPVALPRPPLVGGAAVHVEGLAVDRHRGAARGGSAVGRPGGTGRERERADESGARSTSEHRFLRAEYDAFRAAGAEGT